MKINLSYKRIGLPEFENLLSKYWKSSFNDSTAKIFFDLSNVEYIDLPQMCLLFLWVEKLLKIQKKVTLHFEPQSLKRQEPSKVFSVIENYGFFSCLSHYDNLNIEASLVRHPRHLIGAKLYDSPVIHLTSLGSRQRLNTFIKDLDPESTSSASTVTKREREIIDRIGVRNIFLKELGLNVFDHADGESAVVAVSRKSAQQLNYTNNAMPIRALAQRRNAAEYIQVVVADFGPGIPKKLRDVFTNDIDAHAQLDATKESSLVEYAFWQDVTSKPQRTLDEILDAEDIDEQFIPPTGLYFVSNLVRRQKGLLYVRTAKTIWGLDYSSGGKVIIEQSSWKSKNEIRDELVEITGTLITVFIPLDNTETVPERILFSSSKEKKRAKVTSYLSVESLTLEMHKSDEKKIAIIIIAEIKRLTRRLKSGTALLIDFSHLELATKYLFKIILYAMYRQSSRKLIVISGFSPDTKFSVVNQEIIKISGKRPDLLPVTYYDGKRKEISLIGSADSILNSQDLFDFSFYIQNLAEVLEESRDSVIQKQINAAFYPEEKVFLPSRVYIKGYFELADLLGHPFYSKKLADKIVNIIPDQNYIAIVATAGNLSRFASEVATNLKLTPEDLFIAKGETPPVSALYPIRLKFDKENDGNVLILSDVVVTGRSVTKIAELLPCPVVIATVIDAKPTNTLDAGNVVKLVYIRRHHFDIHNERPHKWNYEEIRLVDPISHKLIFYGPSKAETLLDSESHLRSWIVEDKALRCGHYHYNDFHVNYFFDTYHICDKEHYQSEIVETIRKDVEMVLAHGGDVTHICYPEGNKAAEGVCLELQPYIGGRLIFLPRLAGTFSTSRTMPKQEEARIIVFVDTAATTGQTAMYAMKLASELGSEPGAEKLLLYIVVNRIAGRWPQAFEHISHYKGIDVRIKSLVKAELPAYTPKECPLCERRLLIDSFTDRFLPSKVRIILREISEGLRPCSIKELRERREREYEYDGDATLQQVRFRDQIEREMKSVTYAAQQSLIEQVKAASQNRSLARGIISCMALEGERLLGAGGYENLLNSEFHESLFSLVLTVGTDTGQPLQVRNQAIWVACLSNFSLFLDSLVNFALHADNELIIKELIAATITYSARDSALRCCEALEKVQIELHRGKVRANLSDTTLRALSEALGYYRFRPTEDSNIAESYTDAYRILTHVFEQPHRTHPDIRRAFDTSVRVVEPEDLKNKVMQAYLGNDGFLATMKDKILPALKRVIGEYPEEVLLDARYLTDDGAESLISDLRELDLQLTTGLSHYLNKTLTEAQWHYCRDRIKAAAERILINFLSTERSVLKKILKRAKCSVDSVIHTAIDQCQSMVRERNITITKNIAAASEVIIIPARIVSDVMLTVLENAITYGEENSTVLVQAFLDNKGVCITIDSSPTAGHKPELKEGHGLMRALSLLKKLNSELFIDEDAYKRGMIASIKILLPTERRVLYGES